MLLGYSRIPRGTPVSRSCAADQPPRDSETGRLTRASIRKEATLAMPFCDALLRCPSAIPIRPADPPTRRPADPPTRRPADLPDGCIALVHPWFR